MYSHGTLNGACKICTCTCTLHMNMHVHIHVHCVIHVYVSIDLHVFGYTCTPMYIHVLYCETLSNLDIILGMKRHPD